MPTRLRLGRAARRSAGRPRATRETSPGVPPSDRESHCAQQQPQDHDYGDDEHDHAHGAVVGHCSLLPVVLELQRDRVALRLLAETGDHALELVLALAADADRVALDLILHLREFVANQLADLLGQILREATAQPDALTNGIAARLLYFAPVEDLERQPTANGLRLQ